MTMEHAEALIENEVDVSLKILQEVVHKSCVEAGWYTNLKTGEPHDRNVGEMLALVHSEVSEALGIM